MNLFMSKTRRLAVFGSIAVIAGQFDASAFGQSHPHLFRQRPVPVQPERNASVATMGDADHNLLVSNPASLTIIVPGKPDLMIDRQHHEQRSAQSMVWRGQADLDPSSKVTLTLHDGILLGHIQSGNEIFSLRPGRNGSTIIEKIDTDSFNPEWGHDHRTHGHDKVPPKPAGAADLSGTSAATAPATAAATTTTEIVLMSVYTPQARAAAGGIAQIQAQIQAAVDQANTAFINSNMIARYHLAHTAEVVYNDSGNIETDLNWVTGDAGVASLRNTHSADMVSLITENGGGYCGIGWVQRNPGAGFASYAFQVTARGCLTNSTLAHEHGHNLGMEHDPTTAGISPAGASYDWSFGHNVPGSFRTIMSYTCAAPCPRVLHFSNPDILYNGLPTGIANQRDNAWTGDLTAPIVANFRTGGAVAANGSPAFTTNPIITPDATKSVLFLGSLVGSATDPDGDPLKFSKTAGPTWLTVAANGALKGTPGLANGGPNDFTVSVSDGKDGTASATLRINVVDSLPAPSNLVATSTLAKQINLTWADNSNGESGFRIERSLNGTTFSRIATVRSSVTSYANKALVSGRNYIYRVRAYYGTHLSDYSNTANATAQ